MRDLGMSWSEGEARSIPISRVDELQAVLEDPQFPKVRGRYQSLTRALLGRNITPAGFTDDPTLYAFLLDADLGRLLSRSDGGTPPRTEARSARR